MARTVCYTIFTFGYLSRACVLVETVRVAHPDWEMLAVIADAPPPGLPPEALAPFDRVMWGTELGIPRFRAWMFKHDIVEACSALKGPTLRFLLAEGADLVVFLDPDIAVFHPLDLLTTQHATASIILTPHQIAPNDDPVAIRESELVSMKYGIYNLGFIAVRNDDNGRAFAHWWAEATLRAGYDDPAEGLFGDQKYCDLAPALFDGVQIARDPGCNVASWNLSRRHIAFAPDGGIRVNGAPLRFYHFTKITGVGALMTERTAGDNTEVYEIVNWYKRSLIRNSFAAADAAPWHFAHFDTGETIPRPLRLFWRDRTDLVATFDDPFATGPGTLHAWLTQNRPDLLETHSA